MHNKPFNSPRVLILIAITIAFLTSIFCSMEQVGEGTRFLVSFDPAVQEAPLSGRVLLLISNTEQFNIGPTGSPVFGKNVDDLMPGETVTIDGTEFGFPVNSLDDIPAGDYFAQAYLNVYTTFERSDGHTVKLHMDQGEGQNWRRSPGNLFSEPQKISFDPDEGSTINITMNRKIPPIAEPTDTKWVKNVKIQSKLLTEFWGQPMYIGARILLPKGFEEHPEARYPVINIQGHFPRGNPGGFREEEGNPFYEAWNSEDFPRMLVVSYLHANPYYDDSYGVDSENVGPYGRAMTEELIPYVEEKFRAIGKPYARILTGGSTGGWISLAMQVWNPDYFGGTWTFAPDQVDFRKFQQANLYDDDNAYFTEHDWTKVPRPLRRSTDGSITYTMEQFTLIEEAIGDRYRSGRQFAIFNAVFAPVDVDGYPKPLWDPLTGKIDHEVTQWAKEHYDIRYYLENNWNTVGKKLEGKINIFAGRMDNYYLNEAVYLLQDFLETTTDPYYAGRFVYGDRGGHGWNPWGNTRFEMYREIAEHITKNAPPGENTLVWKYK